MKKLFAILLVLVMVIGVAGCTKPTSSDSVNSDSSFFGDAYDDMSTDDSSEEQAPDSENADSNDSQSSDEQTSEPASTNSNTNTGSTNTNTGSNTNSSSQTGNSKADEFLKWTDVDMVNYLKAEGVFTHDDWLYTQTEGDEAPIGITKLVSYMDDYYDADVIIMWLKPNASTKRTEEIYNEIKTTHTYIMTEAENFPQPMNTMIGRFAFFYSWSLDTELVDKMTAALEKLEKTYGVKRDFINMDVDMSDYEDWEDDDAYYVD